MFGSRALDVVFGLVFVYLVLSLLCSALNETLASVLAWRAKVLREGIANLLGSTEAAAELYQHPLIKSITRNRGKVRTWVGGRHKRLQRFAQGRYPSYLPPESFVTALIDYAREKGAKAADPSREASNTSLKDSLDNLPDSQFKDVLLTLYRESDGKVDRFRVRIEGWYDDAMDRVSGWYRRRVQVVLWAIALLLVSVLNADTFQLSRTLWNDDAVRDAVVVQAEEVVQEAPEGEAEADAISEAAERVENVPQLAIPLGWSVKEGDPQEVPRNVTDWIFKLAGLFATAAALTFGAPFWFDLLRRVGGVRSTGKRPRGDPGARSEPNGDEKGA
jgi:hypothetical protein